MQCSVCMWCDVEDSDCSCHLCLICKCISVGKACDCYKSFFTCYSIVWTGECLYIATFKSLQLAQYYRPFGCPQIPMRASGKFTGANLFEKSMELCAFLSPPGRTVHRYCSRMVDDSVHIWLLAIFLEEDNIIKVSFHDEKRESAATECTTHCWVQIPKCDDDRVIRVQWNSML